MRVQPSPTLMTKESKLNNFSISVTQILHSALEVVCQKYAQLEIQIQNELYLIK